MVAESPAEGQAPVPRGGTNLRRVSGLEIQECDAADGSKARTEGKQEGTDAQPRVQQPPAAWPLPAFPPHALRELQGEAPSVTRAQEVVAEPPTTQPADSLRDRPTLRFLRRGAEAQGETQECDSWARINGKSWASEDSELELPCATANSTAKTPTDEHVPDALPGLSQ